MVISDNCIKHEYTCLLTNKIINDNLIHDVWHDESKMTCCSHYESNHRYEIKCLTCGRRAKVSATSYPFCNEYCFNLYQMKHNFKSEYENVNILKRKYIDDII